MSISLVCYILLLLFVFLWGRRNNKESRKVFIVSFIFILLIFCSIRSIEIGADTSNYVGKFYDTLTMDWSELRNRFIERYVFKTEEADIGFYVLEKLVSIFTSNFQVHVFITDLLFFIPLGIIFYRYTTNFYQLTFAFFFFLSLVYVYILFGGRQMLAMGFELMSFLFVVKDKYVKASLCVLVGMLIHMSLLLVLPYIIACKFFRKYEKKLHALSLVLFPVVLLFVNKVIFFMGNFMGMDRYRAFGEGEVQGGASVFIFMIFILSLFCFVAIKERHLRQSEWLQKIYMFLPFMTITGPLIHSNGSMIRVCLYYFIFMMLVVPVAIESFFPKNTIKKAYVVAILLLVIMTMMSGGIDYDFFWNDPPGTWR